MKQICTECLSIYIYKDGERVLQQDTNTAKSINKCNPKCTGFIALPSQSVENRVRTQLEVRRGKD
ncbi:hypothetical protein LCGC14_0995280 [marine sediment metagenome]|uniref:Uncharacterized protein n=1 Tax=marine sediment metagenome TaxID=412755 RepID=A0A0F9N4M8_9ZZZZ